jgi:oligopeptide transport system substrate-binding protein
VRIKKILPSLVLTLYAMNLSVSSLAADTFRFRLQAEPLTLDWTKASTQYETYVLMNIMEGLVEIGPTLQPAPALASKWQVSDDGLTYTFHLRADVKWSDGQPLKAQDFITSWKRLLAPRTTNSYASFLFDIVNAEDYQHGKIKNFDQVGVKAIDKQTLQVRLRRVVPYFLSLLSFWVTFPQHEKMDFSPTKLVTLGPYRLASWTRGKELVFERNPNYYGAKPMVEKVLAIVETDDAKARTLLLDGKIDALLEVSTQDVIKYTLENAGSFSLKQFPYLATVYLAFNVKAAPLTNLNLRKAIALAIDRGGFPSALQGGESPADSLVAKGIAGYEPVAFEFSEPEAHRFLGLAGIANPPVLDLLTGPGKHELVAKFIANSLRQHLGLNVKPRVLPPTEFRKARVDGKFQLAIAQWGADYPDAATFMEVFLSTSGANFTHWKSAQYDTLVKKAGDTVNLLDRLGTYADAQKLLIREEAVVVPLYYPKITALIAKSVANIEISPLNYFFFKRIEMR